MATKSFLTSEAFHEASSHLQPQRGIESAGDASREFSLWLEGQLEADLGRMPEWKLAQPVVTGSWARHEMSPKSDLDVVFAGPHDIVKKLVARLQERGLKLRYRVPEDPANWSVGVEPFDILALLQGRGLTPQAQAQLDVQLQFLSTQGMRFKKELLRAMLRERKERNKRYDSIANFLEPNLKYGAGGLRDLEQALMMASLFSEKLEGWGKALATLESYKRFFLSIRQKLHIMGAGDQLIASEQDEMSRWFGFSKKQDFMRLVQVGLQQVSFLADAVADQVEMNARRESQISRAALESIPNMISALLKDDSAVMQYRVYESLTHLKNPGEGLDGRALERLIRADCPESTLVAAFRSGLLHSVFPEMARLRGWVQHDQYHRYTADAHVLQALREVVRTFRKPQRLGKLKKWVQPLSNADWRILMWSALYHDIGKGLQGDHSQLGREIAGRELAAWGFPSTFIVEVQWLVENHLVLSEAAFRKNPRAPSTWRELHAKQVSGGRLVRLMVLTAIDILATNPEAWNSWKEALLAQMVTTLESNQTESYFGLLSEIRQKHETVSADFLDGLDPSLIEYIPAKLLIEDYRQMNTSSLDLAPLVWRSRKGDTWVRLHSHEDRPGLFAEFVQCLYDGGVSVISASAHTFSGLGAYDWFRVKTTKTPAVLRKILKPRLRAPTPGASVQFDSVRLMGQDESEWVISFRGRDQKGALKAAALALFEEGLTIQWARVHTWGRQIDDIFGVGPLDRPAEETLANLQKLAVAHLRPD